LYLACQSGAGSAADTVLLQGGAPQSVRVLLFETREPVLVWQRGVQHRIEPAGAGLRADTGSVRRVWRSSASGPLRVRDFEVRGVIEIRALGTGRLGVVNEVPLESYLAGTLGREMYGSWSGDALRAQAVASRTYALEQMRSHRDRPWHLRADTQSQVYGGVAAESTAVNAAVEATHGEVLAHRGRPILAAFHSSSGGRTASAEEVWGEPREYLVSIPVEDEWESPDTYWRATVSGTTLGRAVAAAADSVAGVRDIGVIHRVEVIERTDSGRAARIRLRGERGEVTMTGRSLRSALGEGTLRSTLFELHESDGGFVFVGSGRGHGVGMSQWGARAMARRGVGYREILQTFYPGASFRSLPDSPHSPHSQDVSAARGGSQ
jgi:stage II sporulation protein D